MLGFLPDPFQFSEELEVFHFFLCPFQNSAAFHCPEYMGFESFLCAGDELFRHAHSHIDAPLLRSFFCIYHMPC